VPASKRSRFTRDARAAVRVLDEDPYLGAALSGERLDRARSQLVARLITQPTGSIDERLLIDDADLSSLGLLVLDGVVSREVLVEDIASAELIGPGDVIRPWRSPAASRFVRSRVRWTVLEPMRLAVIGPQFGATLVQYPEVNVALLDRITERAHRLALLQALSHLNGVDRRVHNLFWHLAERWGRMTSDGVVMPLALPHRIIADLIGARRPTVTSAIGQLSRQGLLERRADRAWVLHSKPVEQTANGSVTRHLAAAATAS
jgi:hypothetical protein